MSQNYLCRLCLVSLFFFTGCQQETRQTKPRFNTKPDDVEIIQTTRFSYKFDININNQKCTTNNQSFNSRHEMCVALQDEKLNNNCAAFEREQKFKIDCKDGEFKSTNYLREKIVDRSKNDTLQSEIVNIDDWLKLRRANLGFKRLESSSISHLSNLKKSIFEIFSYAGKNIMISEIAKKLNTELKYASIFRAIRENKEGRDTSYLVDQIELCQKNNLAESDCSIRPLLSRGTAFIVDDGTELWTASHTLADQLTIDPKVVDTDKIKIQIYLKNEKNEVVFDSKLEPVTLVNSGNKKNGDDCQKYLSDWVKIKLPRSIGPGLKFIKTKPENNEPVFVIGFPKKTTDRQTYNLNKDIFAEDSNGQGIFVTSGVARTEDFIPKMFGKCESSMRSSLNKLLIIDSDSTNGMSGGPMINENGEVFGLYTSVFPSSGNAVSYFTTLGIGVWSLDNP